MNHSYKTNATRECFIPMRDVAQGLRPTKGHSPFVLSGLLLGMMASGVMAQSVLIGHNRVEVSTEAKAFVKDATNPSPFDLNTIYLNGSLSTTPSMFAVLDAGHVGSVGFMSLDGFQSFEVSDRMTGVLTGFEEGNAETVLMKNSIGNPLLGTYPATFVSKGHGSHLQLGWAEGAKRHGELQNLNVSGYSTGEVVNGDFTVTNSVMVGSVYAPYHGGTLTIKDGATVTAKGTLIREEGKLIVEGELDSTNGTAVWHELTIGETGTLKTNTLTNKANGHIGTIQNKGSLTVTDASTLEGITENLGTFTAQALTLAGEDSRFTNKKTFKGKSLTINPVAGATPEHDTTFINQGDLNFESLTLTGGNLRFESGTVSPANTLQLPSGKVEIGKASGDASTFYLANLQGAMDANLVVDKTGMLAVANAVTAKKAGQLHFSEGLAIGPQGTLSVMNTTPVTAGSAHIGAGSVTSIDFAAIATKTTPVLTTANGTLTVDAGATLTLKNVSDLNLTEAERFQITEGSLPGLDPADHTWAGGWTHVSGDNSSYDYALTWKDNPDDEKSDTLLADALYVLLKPREAQGDFTDNAVTADAIRHHNRLSVASFSGRSGSLWRTDDADMGRTLWVDGIAETVNAGHQHAYKYHRVGLVMGADRRIGEQNQALVGVAGSVTHATGETTRQDAGTDLKIDAVGLYAYGAYRWDERLVNGHVGYVYQSNHMAQTDQKAKVKHHMVTAGASLAQRFTVKDRVVVAPHVGLSAGWLLSSNYDIRQQDTVIATKHTASRLLLDVPVGVSVEARPYAVKGWTMTPSADVTLTKPLGQTSMRFNAAGSAQPEVRDMTGATTSWTLGLDAQKATWEVNTRYRFTHGAHHHREHALDVRVVKAF